MFSRKHVSWVSTWRPYYFCQKFHYYLTLVPLIPLLFRKNEIFFYWFFFFHFFYCRNDSLKKLSTFAESAMSVNRVIVQHFSMNLIGPPPPKDSIYGLSPPSESSLMQRRQRNWSSSPTYPSPFCVPSPLFALAPSSLLASWDEKCYEKKKKMSINRWKVSIEDLPTKIRRVRRRIV